MTSPDEAKTILDKLAQKLRARNHEVETLDAAYEGEFKLHYASDDFRQYHADRYRGFSDNWCGIVADAPHERLELTGIRLDGAVKGDEELRRDWLDNSADEMSDQALLDAIIGRRAYAMVWGSRDGEPVITWEHATQAIVGYDPETRERVAGAKIWSDDTHEYATLVLPDEVFKFQRPRIISGITASGLHVPTLSGDWKPRQPASDDTWPLRNPLGKVFIVEFGNRGRLRAEPISDITGTLAMQHAINLLWAYLFNAADYASFPQRVILGAEMPTVPILDADGQVVGERPVDLKKFAVDRVAWLEDPNTKIDQWDAAKLDVYTDIIEIQVGHIAAQTRTPAHYLLVGGTIANVPEGALKALETGLVKRTEQKAQHFSRPARDVFQLMALVRSDEAKAAAVRRGKVLWKDIENRSEAQRADALSKKFQMGYPLRYILELDGVAPTEIDRVMRMAEEEASSGLVRDLLRVPPGGDVADDGS